MGQYLSNSLDAHWVPRRVDDDELLEPSIVLDVPKPCAIEPALHCRRKGLAAIGVGSVVVPSLISGDPIGLSRVLVTTSHIGKLFPFIFFVVLFWLAAHS
jgi:hypothetical protein